MIKILLCKTYDIDKILSPLVDDICKLGRHFDINIPRLSVRGLLITSMLTKYLPLICTGEIQCENS